jgi:hypothetical protein
MHMEMETHGDGARQLASCFYTFKDATVELVREGRKKRCRSLNVKGKYVPYELAAHSGRGELISGRKNQVTV